MESLLIISVYILQGQNTTEQVEELKEKSSRG